MNATVNMRESDGCATHHQTPTNTTQQTQTTETTLLSTRSSEPLLSSSAWFPCNYLPRGIKRAIPLPSLISTIHFFHSYSKLESLILRYQNADESEHGRQGCQRSSQ